MHDQSSRFLDRVQEESGIRERGRALSGVRAVYYAVFRSLGQDGAGPLAESLPPELESLWKPAYFQCLRDDRDRDGPERPDVEEALRRVQRLTPTVNGDEAGLLLRAVLRILREELEDERWAELSRNLPAELEETEETSGPAGS